MPCAESRGCECIRLAEAENLTTTFGVTCARSAVLSSPTHIPILIWLAIRCTGGSHWQNMNVLRPGGEERINDHIDTFMLLWRKC